MKNLFLIAIIFLIQSNLLLADIQKVRDWYVQIDEDAITDEKDYMIWTKNIPTSNSYPNQAEGWFGFLMKDYGYKNFKALYIDYDDYVCGMEGDEKLVNTIFRVDKNEPQKNRINNTGDRLSGYDLISDKITEDLIEQMFKGNNLVIRVFDDMCSQVVDYKFSLDGFSDAHNLIKHKGALKN